MKFACAFRAARVGHDRAQRVVADEGLQVGRPLDRGRRQKAVHTVLDDVGIGSQRGGHGDDAQGHVLSDLEIELAPVPFVVRQGNQADVQLLQIAHFRLGAPRLGRAFDARNLEAFRADQVKPVGGTLGELTKGIRDQPQVRCRRWAPAPADADGRSAGASGTVAIDPLVDHAGYLSDVATVLLGVVLVEPRVHDDDPAQAADRGDLAEELQVGEPPVRRADIGDVEGIIEGVDDRTTPASNPPLQESRPDEGRLPVDVDGVESAKVAQKAHAAGIGTEHLPRLREDATSLAENACAGPASRTARTPGRSPHPEAAVPRARSCCAGRVSAPARWGPGRECASSRARILPSITRGA